MLESKVDAKGQAQRQMNFDLIELEFKIVFKSVSKPFVRFKIYISTLHVYTF